jgi:predicted dehydrogenase
MALESHPQAGQLRFGIVGSGWVAGARYAPCLMRMPDVEVTAVFDSHQDRADALAARFPRARPFSDWSRFQTADLDAVVVCTPPASHAKIVVDCLEVGRHVLCEKPMALTTADARKMADAARTAGRHLCVSHNFLYSRAIKRADRLLGPEPDLKYVAAVQFSSPERRLPAWYEDLPGGLMTDESPHMLYTLQHFLGRLRVAHAHARWSEGRSTPDSVEILLEGERGPGQLTMVFNSPVSEWQIVVADSRQIVSVDLFRDIAVRVPTDRAHHASDILRSSVWATATHAAGFVSSGVRFALHRQYWGHEELITRFVKACRGEAPIPVSIGDALAVSDLMADVLDRTSNTDSVRD